MTKTLVVDDDMDIRDFVALVLGRAGHEVVTAQDGQEALDLLSGDRFDLVVSDHHMPRVTGAEVIGHLHTTSPDTCAVLMSGDHEVRHLDSLVPAAPVFLRKPFNRHRLLGAVESLVGPSVETRT